MVTGLRTRPANQLDNPRPRGTPRRANLRSKLHIAARRHPLVVEIERGLLRCGVPLRQDKSADREFKVVIGVSGGADSVALLLGCLAISRRSREPSGLSPIVVHVHHHLRSSADDDAEWVAALCDRFDLPRRIEHVEPATLRGNVSANARRLRYEALCRAAIDAGAGFVAVAHHGEDQLETILAALCRGAGLDGLAGMPWARSLGGAVTLIRPLLASRRSDCESLRRAAGIAWRDDPSNKDAARARARLRRDVIPVLEELWPDAARRVNSTADLVNSARAALNRQLLVAFGARTECQWPRQSLAALPLSILAAGLRRAALHLKPLAADEINQRHLMAVAESIASRDRSPRQFDWPCDLRVKVTSTTVRIFAVD